MFNRLKGEKMIYRISGKIGLLSYIVVLYQVWRLCQYGGNQKDLLVLLPGVLLFMASMSLWLFSQKSRKKEPRNHTKRKGVRLEIVFVLGVSLYFCSRIVYSAIPYNGALAWKIDELFRKKEVHLEHQNFFENGVTGILKDLTHALDLPKELYISEEFQMTFDSTGEIQTIYTFLYGRDEEGDTRTYLVDYDAEKSSDMIVWVDGEVHDTYEEEMRLEPMLRILEKAPCESQVAKWNSEWAPQGENMIYELIYMGNQTFTTEEGLWYLSGDVDGDGKESGIHSLAQLKNGGEVRGYEVSLHIPTIESVIPVRYIMEPEYINQSELDKKQEQQQTETAKKAKEWTVDNADGTMYFFLNKKLGWRLVVADAAAGSRFYKLEKTSNGGSDWETVHNDPFDGRAGVAEGLQFFDAQFGVVGLAGASQESSCIYITRDGGVTFEEIQLPMEAVTELPEHAEIYGFTKDDYEYLCMPEKEGKTMTIQVTSGAGEQEGFLFQSTDDGITWTYLGTFEG